MASLASPYVELQCMSHFSLLRGASSPEDLFHQAAALGFEALAITDRNTLSGIVRAHVAAKAAGVRLIVGCEVVLRDGMTIVLLPTDRAAYGRLCRLLSLGKQRAGKGGCDLDAIDLKHHAEGLIAILAPDQADATCERQVQVLVDAFGHDAHLALTLRRRPGDALRLFELDKLARRHGATPVVTNRVLYHEPGRRMLQDVVTCIRERTTIEEVGFRRDRHADRYLKRPSEMERLFGRHPEALTASVAIAARCGFSLDELEYQYPSEVSEPGRTTQETLDRLTWEGANERYPEGVPSKVRRILEHELGLIAELKLAPYFLTVNDIVRFARRRGILCQGRGSAANSAICYCLGITAIDPERNDLLFERFVSAARDEPPDIDVDFEHQRREEVIQYIYERYGRHRAALVSTVQRFRPKGALRDVGKVLGLPEDMIKVLTSHLRDLGDDAAQAKRAAENGLDLGDRTLRLTLDLARQLLDTPRHLGQHPGGFCLTETRLDELVPIEPAAMDGRSIIEWEKRDLEVLSFMKVDVLALGMLSALRRGLDLLEEHKATALDLATIPSEDPRTYAMIRRADTVGVFQIESRAQMAMLPRLKPRSFYDLVIEVAIVRPGPIQGDMVHPYLRRRQGLEPVTFPSPTLERVLGKTLGVPLFQEQAMRVAIECAGFTPEEADQLRRGMATFKHTGGVGGLRDKLILGMIANGYDQEFSEKTFAQLEGFGAYGFPESHAASFAGLVYASSWMKCHHPDVFCVALLNSQPMGFYAPAQIVRDAQDHGVEIRPVCVNASRWDSTLEAAANGRLAVRLGLRMVQGLANDAAAVLVAQRQDLPFKSIDEVWRRTGLSPAVLARLADADAFLPGLGRQRREALWDIKALRETSAPLFDLPGASELNEGPALLKPMAEGHEIIRDYQTQGLSLRRHPMALLRSQLVRERRSTCLEATRGRDRDFVRTAGLVLMRQRPGTAKGTTFVTLEDETGIANLVVWPDLYEKFRREVLGSVLLGVEGRVQREGDVVHLVAWKLQDLTPLLAHLREGVPDDLNLKARNFH